MHEFVHLIQKRPQVSSWRDDLSEKPDGRYKFISAEVNFNMDLSAYNRQTYSLLDWLGDIGGLMDALYVIA